jgi:hypothetical protein
MQLLKEQGATVRYTRHLHGGRPCRWRDGDDVPQNFPTLQGIYSVEDTGQKLNGGALPVNKTHCLNYLTTQLKTTLLLFFIRIELWISYKLGYIEAWIIRQEKWVKGSSALVVHVFEMGLSNAPFPSTTSSSTRQKGKPGHTMDVVLFIHGRNGTLPQAILLQGLSLVNLVACIVHFVPKIPFVSSERAGNL